MTPDRRALAARRGPGPGSRGADFRLATAPPQCYTRVAVGVLEAAETLAFRTLACGLGGQPVDSSSDGLRRGPFPPFA